MRLVSHLDCVTGVIIHQFKFVSLLISCIRVSLSSQNWPNIFTYINCLSTIVVLSFGHCVGWDFVKGNSLHSSQSISLFWYAFLKFSLTDGKWISPKHVLSVWRPNHCSSMSFQFSFSSQSNGCKYIWKQNYVIQKLRNFLKFLPLLKCNII